MEGYLQSENKLVKNYYLEGKKVKKSRTKLILALMLTFALLITGCGSKSAGNQGDTNTPEPSKEKEIKIAMVLGEGGRGDLGFNDEAYEGIEKAQKELNIKFDYCEPNSVNEFETQLRMYAETEEYDLIIAVGATQLDAIKIVAAEFPEQNFSIIDTVLEDFKNVHSVSARNPEQSFLSGVLAGIATQDERFPLSNKENVIAFAVSMDSPLPRQTAAGFMAGAKYINPEVEIIYNFVGSYRDPGKAKEIAMTAFQRGADIISHNAGASGLGVFNAAKEMKKYAIGTSRQSADPDFSLCVSVKKTEEFVFQEIEDIKNGTWKPGSTQKGLAEGICDYDISGLKVQVPGDVIEKLDAIKKDIIDGKLKLPYKIEDVDEWAKNNQYNK